MKEAALQFGVQDSIGKIAAVDTSRAVINITRSDVLTRVGIGNLIAIRGTTEREFLIALTERATRSLKDDLVQSELDPLESNLEIVPSDSLRVVLIGTFRTVDGSKTNTFKRGADSFPQIDRDCYFIEGGNLQRFMNLLGASLPEAERLILGHFVVDRSAAAIANGDKFFQRHAAILGSTGSGKSWAVALLLERASKLTHPNLVVFDMHGEYRSLTQGPSAFAESYRIAGPGDIKSSSESTLFLPYWLLNREEMLSMLLDRSDSNAPNQASRFHHHVRALKERSLEKEDKLAVKETFTVDSPIPYSLDELVSELRADNTRKGEGQKGPVKGEWEDKLTRFISRLETKIEDRRYGFMFQPPAVAQEYEWLAIQASQLLGVRAGGKGVKIIDFSEVPSDVLPVVTGVLARLLYDVQFWMNSNDRTPITLVCDEAHLYLPVRDDADSVQKQALGAFERIAKEGRKYGVSLVVVSQRPSDVSRTILSQCNNFLALRLTNDADQAVIKRLMPDALSGITEILPLLDVGEAIMLGDAVLIPSRIKLDPPTLKPDSATKEFWSEWGTNEPNSKAIAEAVESLRSQTRPASI